MGDALIMLYIPNLSAHWSEDTCQNGLYALMVSELPKKKTFFNFTY